MNDQTSSSEIHEAREQEISARKAIRLVWDEVRKYGASKVEFDLSATAATYRFELSDGRSGEGSVNVKFSQAISNVLNRLTKLALANDELHVTRLRAGSYRLSIEANATEESTKVIPFAGSQKKSQESSAVNTAASSTKRNETNSGAGNVLIVEDNKTFSKVLVRFLERQGFTVEICGDGQQGIDKLRNGLIPDLVISDLHMPHVSGDEFAVLMRGMESLENVPLMLLTSDRAIEAEMKALEAGADLFLAKSEDPRLIAAYAKRLLKRARLCASRSERLEVTQ